MIRMLSKVKVRCHFCRKQFLTKRAYFVFNKTIGYHSFCSKKCQHKSQLRGKTLTCDNIRCDKKFYRAPNNILSHNYCSRSCAAIVNNQRYPKWPKRYCVKCRTEFKNRNSKYCSSKCGWSALYNNHGHITSKYTSGEIRETIKKLAKKLGRSPSRRELGNISYAAIRSFGSWNKAVAAVGLEPHRSHDHRMYKRSRTKATDGHLCDSISEAIIDNWLHKNKIKHSRNVQYPNTNHLADWAVNNRRIFIEYFGLANDSPRYDRCITEKKLLCKEGKIKLIEIYPKDLYPKNLLNLKLSKLKIS